MADATMAATMLTSPINTFPTAAQVSRDAKREADHKHKWKLGERFYIGDEAHPRPERGVSQHAVYMDKIRDGGKHSCSSHHAAKALARRYANTPAAVDGDLISTVNAHGSGTAHVESVFGTPSSDGDDVFGRGNPDGEPDAGIAYSFDRATGPSDGSDVLSQALGQAVERFEDKKVRKLVRDEYDVVGNGDDEEDEHTIRARQVEDDFEMLGAFEA